MKKALWRVAEVLMWSFLAVIFLDSFWSPLRAGNPTLDFCGLVEHQQAGLLTGALLGMLVSSIGYRLSRPIQKAGRAVDRWQQPTGPGAKASIGDAIRLFPVHTLLCAVLIAAVPVAFWTDYRWAILLLSMAGAAAVTLARRLGLEPPDDPAAPHNREGA